MSGAGEARGKGGEGAEHFGRGRGGKTRRVEKVCLLFFVLTSRVVRNDGGLAWSGFCPSLRGSLHECCDVAWCDSIQLDAVIT